VNIDLTLVKPPGFELKAKSRQTVTSSLITPKVQTYPRWLKVVGRMVSMRKDNGNAEVLIEAIWFLVLVKVTSSW